VSSSRLYRENEPALGISPDARARLHRQLDELLDLQNEIVDCVSVSGMSDQLADRLQSRAERLVLRTSSIAGEVAGGDARAIAFRHPEPTSREAFSRFLSAVAGYAAPYIYSSLNLGVETFTSTDAKAVLDDMKSLDHGDTPAAFRPAAKRYPRGTRYQLLKEQLRAVQWVSYLTGQTGKEAAVKEVAEAYGVSDRTVYGWHEATEQIESGYQREWHSECAREDGRARRRPHFTRSTFRFEDDRTYPEWLEHDASYYKNLSFTGG